MARHGMAWHTKPERALRRSRCTIYMDTIVERQLRSFRFTPLFYFFRVLQLSQIIIRFDTPIFLNQIFDSRVFKYLYNVELF